MQIYSNRIDYKEHCSLLTISGDGFERWKQYRFRQFYLDVSDLPVTQTTTTERTRCYTDNTTYPNLPPNIINIPCKQTARYVIVETTYDAPEDDPHKGAMLEICEIQVKGFVINCVSHLTKIFKELRTSISYITQAINSFLIPPPRQKKSKKNKQNI